MSRCQPVLLAAHRLRKTEGDRQARGLFKGQAEADNRACCHIGSDSEIGASYIGALTIDDFHELDVGRGMIDLDDVECVFGPDIARARFQTPQAFPS